MNRNHHFLKQALVAAMVAAAIFAVYKSAQSAIRISASYAVTIEAATNAGGAASSASYEQPDSAAGQDVSGGPAASASYKEQGGVVQYWGTPSSGVSAWQDHE
jgi:hypothetical protein